MTLETASAARRPSIAARLDRIPPVRMHRRLSVAVGFANFFDLYDIFLGGVLAAVLAPVWALSTDGKALVIGSGFGGMFVGANVLSALADRLGRRRVFLWNLLIYSGFSLAAAFSPNLAWLAILRFCAGIGLGAELSLSDTYLSELLTARGARALHGRRLHPRVRRRAAGGVRRRPVRRQAPPSDRRLAMATGHRLAGGARRLGDATKPSRVTALA